METFNLSPKPEILIALTHTELKPIDALCELIDNAVDSFSSLDHKPSGENEINIHLPTVGEIRQNQGLIRVADNGPGMTSEQAQKALTAGYSSQNAFSRLGMFGMGLNIATGKFARITRLITATKESDKAIVVEINLEELVKQGHFNVQPYEEDKNIHFPGDGGHGTIIELSGWWHEGNPNRTMPLKLVQPGPLRISEKIGRRYATLLRGDFMSKFNITIKGISCKPFEHCVWRETRYVTRGNERIPAKFTFDEVLRTENRCAECGVLTNEHEKCPVDPSHSTRSVEERIRGWIGVQRFDDNSHFGIDLIRNGRAIRVLEKDAFFTYESDEGTVKDYPIDSQYGRIVGEIHLNHIRVDFTKQNFERHTPEWSRAMEFIRGNSSLQPNQPNAQENSSYMMKIYKGYRRVRNFGLPDMYMGERQPNNEKASRISREIERDFYERFKNKDEGYHDDSMWWEKVEDASREIEDTLEECPKCKFQNPTGAEVCGSCDFLLKGKKCNNLDCDFDIPRSALKCEHCGSSQIPEGPWTCQACNHKKNPAESEKCARCQMPKGSIDNLNPDILIQNSSKNEELSVGSVEIDLHQDKKSTDFRIETYNASLKRDVPSLPTLHLPIIANPLHKERCLQLFIDRSHYLFSSMQLRPEHAVAMEAAMFIRAEAYEETSGPHKNQCGATALQERILDKYWRQDLSEDPASVRESILGLFNEIRTKIYHNMQDISEDCFNNMSSGENSHMIASMSETGEHLDAMLDLKESGKFFLYVPPKTVISIFQNFTGRFFENTVWKEAWDIPGIPSENVEKNRKEIKEKYLNCLEDSVTFLQYQNPELVITRRAQLSVEFLTKKLVD